MVAVFGLVALTGAVALLFGWNDVRSGHIDDDQAAQSELLASLRSVGRIFVRVGQLLLLIGLLGMALTALVLLIW